MGISNMYTYENITPTIISFKSTLNNHLYDNKIMIITEGLLRGRETFVSLHVKYRENSYF